MAIRLRNILPVRKFNQCKNCQVAPLCLPSNIQKKLLKRFETLKFKSRLLRKGEHLCRQGEYSQNLYAIRSGILKSYLTKSEGEEYIMGFHLAPDLFGWEGLDQTQISLSVVAIDQSNVCEIPLNQLSDLFAEVPALETRLFQMMSRRVRSHNYALLRTTAEQRVASFILEFAEHYRLMGNPYYLCKLEMTHQDIANYLRIAPETMSRTFKQLQQKELIQMSRKKIWIKNFDLLQALADLNH